MYLQHETLQKYCLVLTLVGGLIVSSRDILLLYRKILSSLRGGVTLVIHAMPKHTSTLKSRGQCDHKCATLRHSALPWLWYDSERCALVWYTSKHNYM